MKIESLLLSIISALAGGAIVVLFLILGNIILYPSTNFTSGGFTSSGSIVSTEQVYLTLIPLSLLLGMLLGGMLVLFLYRMKSIN